MLGVSGECFADLRFKQAEDQQRDPDDRDERVDAVVVVQEDRADLECLFEVTVATLDDFLFLVAAQERAGGQAPVGEVGRERVDPVRPRGVRDRVVVALPADRRSAARVLADGDGDQPLDVGGDDLPDTPLDLDTGLVLAAAQAVADSL